MKIRIKSPDLRRIFYVPVEGDAIQTEDEIRLHVRRALKCQYRRLDDLTMELIDGDEVLVVVTKGGSEAGSSVNPPIPEADVVG